MTDFNITIFRNIKETDTPFHRPVTEILNRIKDGASKELVKRLDSNREKQKGMS